MKRAFTLLALTCLLLNSQNSFAKIWRVNNNPDVAADFTTLQAAHDGANAGDTLHIEGSPNNYGGANLTKKLTILGAGYFLEENPNSQALQQSSKLLTITFNTGSNGSQIMGIDFLGNGINVYTDDIVIRRNKFSAPYANWFDYYIGHIAIYYRNGNGATGANNIIVSQNFGVKVSVNHPSTGILITNNYITTESHTGEAATQNCVYVSANAIALVQNNVFRRGKVAANNSNFSNNIMYVGSFEGVGNLYSNNIAGGTQFGTDNGNKANVTMTNVFVGEGTGVTLEGQWKLKAGSPAIAAGYGSTAQNPIDCGMFGGSNAYILAGLPPMPVVYSFEVQPIGSNTDPIDVKVKVKSAGN